MALIVKDRVKETTTTTGTGTVTLGGASTGFRSFADIGNANTTYYCISGGSQFEVGIGTYTSSGTTLSRDTVLSNSLGTTAKIDFSAGTKDVFVTYPSDKALLGDTSAVASTGTGSVVLSDSPTFTTEITSTGALLLTGSDTAAQNIATNQTTGTLTIGGLGATGAITLGRSTAAQTVNIANGATASGLTKTVNIGAGGAAGSTTAIVIGGVGGSTTRLDGTTTANGAFLAVPVSGVITLGSTNGTGTITVGRSTVNQTTDIQAGATASGSTKTMSIGTGGLAGSTTNIAIGSTAGTSTTTVNGLLKQQTYTVATLPTGSAGARSFVTNALAPVFGAAVAGGGAVGVPVYHDGTSWKVG